MSRSQTITNPDWLQNPHASEALVSEFMKPLDLDVGSLAVAIDIPVQSCRNRRRRVINGEINSRSARYFRVWKGFSCVFKTQYEWLQAKLALNGELDRIVSRAA